MGDLWYPAVDCDYLGSDGPVCQPSQEDGQVWGWCNGMSRGVFADLWNVPPFARLWCGSVFLLSPLCFGAWAELLGLRRPLGHKLRNAEPACLTEALEVLAEPSMCGSPELAHIHIFLSQKGAFWFLMVLISGWNSTCCVLVSHSRPRWELRICCSFLLWEQVEREAMRVAKTAQIRVLDLASGLRWKTLKKITNSHWYLISFEDRIIWRLVSQLLGCGGKCSGANFDLYNLSLVTQPTLS